MMKRSFFLLFLFIILFLLHFGGVSGCGGGGDDGGGDGPTDCGELTIAAAVRDLQATDGTFTNKVALSWAAPFLVETVDNDGSVGAHSSAVFDSDGTHHVVYHEVLPSGGGRLKHAWRTTTDCWQTEVVDEPAGGDVGAYTSLDIDISGGNILHASYYDETNNWIKHAWGTTGSWQTGVVDTAVSNSLQSTSLTFNSSDDTLHVVYKGASGLVHAFKSSSSIGTWQTETVVSGWTGQEAQIGLGASGSLHIVYSTVTTAEGGGLSYASNESGSWETEVVDPGLVGGHLDLDTPGSTWEGTILLVSYHDSANDRLKFAWRDDDGVWTTEVVDSDGTVGWDTGIAGTNGSIGTVYISYYDVTNFDLKVASKNLTAGDWTLQTLDEAGTTGAFTSLALNALGQPHITYYDTTATALNRAYVGEEIAYDVGRRLFGETGAFTSIASSVTGTSYDDTSVTPDVVYDYQLVPTLESSTGSAATDSGYAAAATIVDQGNDVGTYSSIAVGTDGIVHIAYHDDTDNDLKYAFKASDSSSWSTEIVDGNISGGDSNVGEHTSIAVASDGTVHITYFSQTDLKLKHASSSEGGWSLETIEDSTGHVGTYNDLAIDDDGTLHVSYRLAGTDSDLKYARKSPGGSWTTAVADSGGDVGQYSSIAVEPGSNPNVHIAYYDDTDHDLKYAKGTWNSATSTYTWATEAVDSTGDVGMFASITIGGDNRIHISYFDNTNDDLKHAWKGLTASSWNIEFAALGSGANFVGQYTNVVVGEGGDIFIAHHGEVPDRLELTTVAVDGAAYAAGTSQTLDSPNVGEYAGMALGPDGTLHLSYYDSTNNALKYTAASP